MNTLEDYIMCNLLFIIGTLKNEHSFQFLTKTYRSNLFRDYAKIILLIRIINNSAQ